MAASSSSSGSSLQPDLQFLFQIRSSQRSILFVIIVAVCTDTFLYSVIVPVLPFSLSGRIGVPEEQVQTYVSLLLGAYALGIMLFSPICGYFADRYPSRQLPFLLGLLTLAVANAALCFGRSLPVLFFGRILQGGAAAVVWAIGYAMVPETVGQEKAGAAIGWVTMGTGIGVLLGPTAGGWVYETWGYYAVFEMSFALLAVDLALRLLVIERKTAEGIVADLEAWQRRSPSSHLVLYDEETALLDGIDTNSLYKVDNSAPHPFPMALLLCTPRFLSALWGINVLAMMLTAFDGVIPLFVSRTFEWGPSEAGLIFLAISFPTLLDPLFGHISDVHGPRWLGIIAFLGAIPAYCLLELIQSQALWQKILLCIMLFMVGLCVCMGMTPLTAECSAVVEEYKNIRPGIFGENGAFAQCFALCNVAFALGGLLGPVLAGYLTERFNFGVMTLTFAGLCLASAIPMYVYCGRPLINKDIPKMSLSPSRDFH